MTGLGRPLRIAVDCMGGDHAPREVVAGALAAAAADRIHVLLVGVPAVLASCLPEGLERAGHAEIIASDGAIPEGAAPLVALRAAPNASTAVAMRQVAEGRADAAVSAGSTGPTLLAAVRELGMLRGVRRACVGRQILGLHP
jgi:phosphate acyltransferase